MPSSTCLVQATKAALLALGLLLLGVPVSQATVYTGSATDPGNDLLLDMGDVLPSPAVNFTAVSVRHDDVAGRVDVSYTFNQPPASDQVVSAGVGLGSLNANGDCVSPWFTSGVWPVTGPGEVAVVGHSSGFSGTVSGHSRSSDAEHQWGTAALFDWPGSPKRTWNFATIHPSLVGERYTCARAAIHVFAGGLGVDYLDRSFFAVQPVVVATPSAQWLSPRDGQTVSGVLREGGAGAQRCEARITGPVVRTENYVDGRLNDTQAFAPWSCEWDTRNYVNGGHRLTVNAYDAANKLIATDTVRVVVNNPNPPATDNPPAPKIETEPGVVVPSGSPGTQPGATTPATRFTSQKARRAVKRALARRYGRAFRLRRGYTASCLKAGPSRWSCTVRWRYGQFVYKGKIKLRLRSDGRIASRTVLRKLIR